MPPSPRRHPAPPAAALLVVGGLLLGAAASLAAATPRTREPVEATVILRFPDAPGPPERTCREALAAAAAPRSPPERPPRRPPEPPPAPPLESMEQVVLDGAPRAAAELPGADPDALPPRPLEGPPEIVDRVGAVLRRAERGERVRMTFYGASHVAGDWFTGTIRRTLQDRYGDLGHGFVLPAALYRGYRGHDVNLCRTGGWFGDWATRRTGRGDGLLGFAGMSVSSDDPADFGWIETTHTNPHGRRVASWDLYTLGTPEGGTLLVQVDDRPARPVSTRTPAPTLQRTTITAPDGPHRLTLRPAGDGEVRVLGVSAERPGPGVLVDNLGIRGQQARSWLSWNPEMLGRGLHTLDPDLVVLAYGTNEAADHRYPLDRYEQDLRAVLGLLRNVLPEPACVLVGPSDRAVEIEPGRYAIWDRTAPVAEVQRRVAPEFGCAFWDWQAATGGPGSQLAWRLHDPPLVAPDLIHHTPQGYERVAALFVEALDLAAVGRTAELPRPDPAGG